MQEKTLLWLKHTGSSEFNTNMYFHLIPLDANIYFPLILQ